MEFFRPPPYWLPTLSTVKPAVGTRDSVKLKEMLEKNDVDGIFLLLSRRTNKQRQRLRYYYPRYAYRCDFSRDLLTDLIAVAPGLEDLIRILMNDSREVLAAEIQQNLQAHEDHLVVESLLCLNNLYEVDQVDLVYKELFGQRFTEMLPEERDAQRPLGSFLRRMVAVERGSTIDMELIAPSKCKELKTEPMKNWLMKAESKFVKLFTKESFVFIQRVMELYEGGGPKMEEKVEASDLPSSWKKGLLVILGISRNQPTYFARKLQTAIDNFGRNRQELLRLIVRHAEIDLANIKDAYASLYGLDLETKMDRDLQGVDPHCKLVLMQLISEPEI